jgi:hypothetical protein
MSHVSSFSSQLLVVKLGLGLASLAQGGGRNLDKRLGSVIRHRTRVFEAIQDFLVSGARLYYRGPEVYLYVYKYSTLGGGFTATLSFSAT